jgi:hypothetical protein
VRRPLLVLVAVQVALPLVLLADRWLDEGAFPVDERGASFQMYSSAPALAYEGVDAAGRVRPLDVGVLPVWQRAVATGDVVPRALCDRSGDLVLVRRTGGADPGEHRC